jgi:hypothetical protein
MSIHYRNHHQQDVSAIDERRKEENGIIIGGCQNSGRCTLE